jgi:hypothetical protein
MPKKPEDPKPVPKTTRKKQRKIKKNKSEDPRPLEVKTVVDTKRKEINPDPK